MSFPAPRQRAGGTAQGRPGSLARPGSRVHYGKPNQGSSNEKRVPVLYLVRPATAGAPLSELARVRRAGGSPRCGEGVQVGVQQALLR